MAREEVTKPQGKVLTLAQAKALRYNQIVYHRTRLQGSGPVRVRVSSAVKLWKTRPNDFRVAVKWGLYANGEITQDTRQDWTLDNWDVQKAKGQKATCACNQQPAGNRAWGKYLSIDDVISGWASSTTRIHGDGWMRSGSVKSDGKTLYSYNLVIGVTENGRKIVYDYTGKHGRSVTTSKHVGLAKKQPHVTVTKPPNFR